MTSYSVQWAKGPERSLRSPSQATRSKSQNKLLVTEANILVLHKGLEVVNLTIGSCID